MSHGKGESYFRAQSSLQDSSETDSAPSTFNNREAHVRKSMKHRESEYTNLSPIRVFCGTWNVNGQSATENLRSWLHEAINSDPAPAIIALGFQELDLSNQAYVFSASLREEEWLKAAESAVAHISHKYKTLKVVRLVGIMLILFVSEALLPDISHVAASTVATGIMGILGNKGGVAIRLNVHNTTVCCVSSHLAAHPDETERRNQDFKDINERMMFDGVDRNEISIPRHDIVFWLGDLNYRIDGLSLQTVKKHISYGSLDALLNYDQLSIERKNKNVFMDYKEHAISFAPTYKYDIGTNNFDSSEKSRCPSWTDRILYRGRHITPVSYVSHMEFLISDHKPVSALFNVEVKKVDHMAYKKVYEDVLKILDKLENEYLPQVAVDCLDLDFGVVKFHEPVVKMIKLKNTGQVPADFSFIPKHNEPSYCKSWLTVKPCADCFLPGEVIELEFTLDVTERSAAALTYGMEHLEDILILHLDGGKDYFITVSGKYEPSCYGSSLETLVRLCNPIREMSRDELAKLETSDKSNLIPVPKELWFLCENINNKGKTEEDLFQQRGLHQEVMQIRESLDTSLSSDLPGTAHSLAEALLVFLDSLKEAVIPSSLCDEALQVAHIQAECKEVVSSLPEVHKAVFEYLIEFMVELLNYKSQNNLDLNILGNVFGPVMIRPNRIYSRQEKQQINQRSAQFIKQFLI